MMQASPSGPAPGGFPPQFPVSLPAWTPPWPPGLSSPGPDRPCSSAA